MDLQGASGLVTGGASGIGAATVSALQAEGCRVAVLDREEAGSAGDLTLKCDVAVEDEVVDAVAQVVSDLGGLDVAVLNAGVGGGAKVVDMTADEWDRVHAVNLRGTFLSLRECGRAMRERGGAIVAVTSVSATTSERFMAHYSSSKAGAEALVKVAARELGPHGVRVNAVAPGTTDTPMYDATRALPGFEEQVTSRAALGRLGSPEEIAAAVVAVAKLDWVTGQVLAADGGLTLWSPLDPMEPRERNRG